MQVGKIASIIWKMYLVQIFEIVSGFGDVI